ncbi:MAG: ApbE family lipoprotein [Hyphomicrobiales bacterium]|nr:ApbE family lipoprotein [Hyphomicrobiales bacterium]
MSKMSTEAMNRAGQAERRALNGPTMGSRWSAAAFGSDDIDFQRVACALQRAVDRVEQQMSTWKPDSDLNRLNASAVGTWVDIPRELMAVLEAALEIGRASQGAFDIGVGDLVKAWGFGFGARQPDHARIAGLRRPIFEGPKTLQLDVARSRARRLVPMRLDLSGIAKGFGVDELARVMRSFGISSFLVGIDGEMCAAGAKPDGRLWAIAREKPLKGARDVDGVLELRDVAVATSGNYRRFTQCGGREASHTMDPRAGVPSSNDLAAVTVLAPTCMVADAWATALLVMGAEQGLAMARACRLSAIFVKTDGAVIVGPGMAG